MTFDAALFNSTQLWLPIQPEIQAAAWQQSRSFAQPAAQWNAYLNQLSLQTLLPYLRQDAPQAQISPTAAQNWGFVNGLAIAWEQDGSAIAWEQRLVLIPTETIDLDEIRIPQEWVDIPSWAADYYWIVQINPDDAWVNVAGFVTHQQLKQRAKLDVSDRTYCLDGADLMPDLSLIWLSQRLGWSEVTRAALPEIAALSESEAANLIQQLSQSGLESLRLTLPFERWAGLLEHRLWGQWLEQQQV